MIQYSQILEDLRQRRDLLQSAIAALEPIVALEALGSPKQEMQPIPHATPVGLVFSHIAQTSKKIVRRAGRKPSGAGDPKTRTEKPCNRCHAVKLLIEYPLSPRCSDGHSGTCKPCIKAQARKRYIKAHSAPAPAIKPEPAAVDLKCKLCNAPASSQQRLDSHMRVVHNMATA